MGILSTMTQNILVAFVILSDLLASFSSFFEKEELRHYFAAVAICFTNAVLFVLIGGLK